MPLDPSAATHVALSIARYLCDTAYRYDGKLAWMGTAQEFDESEEGLTFSWVTLGPDLFDGTSGIALFLAEAWVRSGDPRMRDAAEGAVRHALSRLADVPREARFGYYAGLVGIAYSALRVGRLLERRDLAAGGRDVLADLAAQEVGPIRLDLLNGAASAVPALLVLADWTANLDLRRLARDLGDRMLDGATRTSDGWSWGETPPGGETFRHLTGLSHGAAGFGWALLELWHATGEARFHEGARGAFRYENRWFRPDRGNWPDFRDLEVEEGRAPCSVAWSNGAPGIGLTRVRAMELDGDEQHRRDAETAVRTTLRALRDENLAAGFDFSLCDGFAGIGEFLLRAADVLGDAHARHVALEFAARGAARYANAPESWPCGLRRGSTPSLMLGLAGIGYFYLRLADPRLPSLLLVGPGYGSAAPV